MLRLRPRSCSPPPLPDCTACSWNCWQGRQGQTSRQGMHHSLHPQSPGNRLRAAAAASKQHGRVVRYKQTRLPGPQLPTRRGVATKQNLIAGVSSCNLLQAGHAVLSSWWMREARRCAGLTITGCRSICACPVGRAALAGHIGTSWREGACCARCALSRHQHIPGSAHCFHEQQVTDSGAVSRRQQQLDDVC